MENMLKNINRNKILDLWPKISNGARDHQSDIALVVGVILISLLSFAMGYIVAKNQGKEPIRLEMTNDQLLITNQILEIRI